MRRTTFVAGLLAAVLLVGYGGWQSAAPSTPHDDGTSTHGDTGGKPGEAPKP